MFRQHEIIKLAPFPDENLQFMDPAAIAIAVLVLHTAQKC